MGYNHFNASLYCPVFNLVSIKDLDDFNRSFQLLEKNIKIGKVYLETYRNGITIEKEQMLRIKAFFEQKGYAVAGGITTDDAFNPSEGGFTQLCYTSESTKKLLREVAALTAEIFDEFILDDFYFTNCRCDSCIQAKGDRSWSQFRLELMSDFAENVIIKTARQVNPGIKAIIKYPNWYEHYQDSGYNLEDEPKIFDYIYTGTETRNPTYTQQHLPKYLSYFIMRYLENIAPGRNLGGWFDPFECSYNLTSYLEQGYLTLFAKAKEAMLFCLGALTEDAPFTVFPPAVGQAFADVDKYISLLGAPVGAACYIPYHSYGEDYLHNYLGMCGIPLEPYPEYPDRAKLLFLSENAGHDINIITKIKESLKAGADVIVTSGFATRLGEAFQELAHIEFSGRKAFVNRYMCSGDGGVTQDGCYEGARKVLLSQSHFFTNDVWQIAGAYGEDNNIPIIMKTSYSKGRLFIITIPDDQGDLYNYPVPVLNKIRAVLSKELPVFIMGDARVALFLYDNDTFILRSFLPYSTEITVTVRRENVVLTCLNYNMQINGRPATEGTEFLVKIISGMNYVLKIDSQNN